jgi:hypothetical protein
VSSPSPLVPARLALVALLAAGLLAARSLRHALEIEPPASFEPARPDLVPVPAPGPGTSAALLTAAVGHDPFHPERRKPALRFRLPGEGLPTDSAATAPAPGGPFLLVGTAVMSQGGGFAMCQWGSEPPKLVRVGERIGTMTLKGVARGQATFVDATGRTVEVRVPKAGT